MSLFRLLPIVFWGFFCLLISLHLATGEWVTVAVLTAPLVFAIMCIVDLKVLALLMLFGFATLFVIPNNILSDMPFIRVERILFALIIGRMIFVSMWRKQVSVAFNTQEKLMFAFLAVLTVSFLTTVEGKDIAILRRDIAFLMLGYAMPLTSFMIARRLEWGYSYLKNFMSGFVVVGLFQTAVGALQRFFGVGLFTPSYEVHSYLNANHELSRVSGTFGNPMEYGIVIAICLVITIWVYTVSTDKLKRLVLLLCACVMLGGMAISMSRTPFVGLLAGLIFLFFLDRRLRPLFLTAITLAFAAFLMALPWLWDTSLFDSAQIVKRFTEMDSIYNRIAVYSTALNMMIHHPVFGVGFGASSFANHLMEYITSIGSVSPQYATNLGGPHNEYLNIGTHAGFTGLALFISILVFTFRNLRLVENTLSLPDRVRHAAQYVRAILLIYCVVILFIDSAPLAYLGILIFFLAGFMASFMEGENRLGGLPKIMSR